MSEIRSTVVIPNYNGIQYIENCLASLKEEPVKVILVEPLSTVTSLTWMFNNLSTSITLITNYLLLHHTKWSLVRLHNNSCSMTFITSNWMSSFFSTTTMTSFTYFITIIGNLCLFTFNCIHKIDI